MAHHPPSSSSPARRMRSGRGRSSTGRAPPLQGGGRGFESPRLHQSPLPPSTLGHSRSIAKAKSAQAGVTLAALRRATPCVAPRRTGRGLPSAAPSQQNTARVASHICERESASSSLPRRPVRPCEAHEIAELCLTEGQVTKGARWMPWRLEPMKDVAWLR